MPTIEYGKVHDSGERQTDYVALMREANSGLASDRYKDNPAPLSNSNELGFGGHPDDPTFEELLEHTEAEAARSIQALRAIPGPEDLGKSP